MLPAATSWSPNSLPPGALVVASCPGENAWGQAVVRLEDAVFDQGLLGFGGQIRLFGQLLKRAGVTLHVVAAPEIFATDESFRHLAGQAGRAGFDGPIVHFRFGMHREARVLKRATNVMVSAEQHVWQRLTHHPHPLADGHTVPALMRTALLLDPDQTPVRTIPGALCRAERLSLEASSREPADAERGAAPPAPYDGRFGSVPTVLPGAAGRCRIMLPWNLSYPGSIVPDLVAGLARPGATAGPEADIFVVPFNAVTAGGGPLDALAAQCRTRPDLAGARVYGARLPDGTALRRHFDLAWLENGDPEYLWTRRYLAALGLPTAVIETVDRPPGEEPGQHRFVQAADRSRLVLTQDQFGGPAGVIRVLSHRGVDRLLRRSVARPRPARA